MIQRLTSTRYRAKQFFSALRPQMSSEDQQLIQDVFSQNHAAWALFQRMKPADQQHATAVLRTVLQIAGQSTHLALQQAALLHDVGKAMGQPLLYRVAVVLLKWLWPAALLRISSASLICPAWRRPFVVNRLHPQIGADWAEASGCSDLTVWLIAHHQEPPVSHPQTLAETLHRTLYDADAVN